MYFEWKFPANRQPPSNPLGLCTCLKVCLGISFLISAATGCKGGRIAELLQLLAFKTCSAAYHVAWGGTMRDSTSHLSSYSMGSFWVRSIVMIMSYLFGSQVKFS